MRGVAAGIGLCENINRRPPALGAGGVLGLSRNGCDLESVLFSSRLP